MYIIQEEGTYIQQITTIDGQTVQHLMTGENQVTEVRALYRFFNDNYWKSEILTCSALYHVVLSQLFSGLGSVYHLTRWSAAPNPSGVCGRIWWQPHTGQCILLKEVTLTDGYMECLKVLKKKKSFVLLLLRCKMDRSFSMSTTEPFCRNNR